MSEYALIVSFITLLALLLTSAIGGEIGVVGEIVVTALAQLS